MASAAVQSVISLGFFLILVLASEAAVINREGSGAEELPPDFPDLFAKDKNLRKIPPFGEPILTGDEFDYDYGVNNPGSHPEDYDYKNPVNEDYDNRRDPWNPEEKPKKKPGTDDRPFKENGGEDIDVPKDNDEEDEDNEIPRKPDEEGKGDEIPKREEEPKKDDGKDEETEEDLDKPLDAEEDVDNSLDEDKGAKVPDDEDSDEDEDKPVEEGEEAGGSEEVPDEDSENTGEPGETGLFHGGFMFDTPFFNMRQVSKYFQQLEKALEHVFRQSMEEAALLNGTYANTTEEEVEIDGKKYLVQKSIIKGNDNGSSIYIEALSSKSKTNNTEG